MTPTPPPLTPAELEDLERKAKAAAKAAPGPWKVFRGVKLFAIFRGKDASTNNCVVNWSGFDQLDLSWPKRGDLAAHIAACDPPTILSLLSQLRAMREALEAMITEKADYMMINNLGDPEAQHTIKIARSALSIGVVGGPRSLGDGATSSKGADP